MKLLGPTHSTAPSAARGQGALTRAPPKSVRFLNGLPAVHFRMVWIARDVTWNVDELDKIRTF